MGVLCLTDHGVRVTSALNWDAARSRNPGPEYSKTQCFFESGYSIRLVWRRLVRPASAVVAAFDWHLGGPLDIRLRTLRAPRAP